MIFNNWVSLWLPRDYKRYQCCHDKNMHIWIEAGDEHLQHVPMDIWCWFSSCSQQPSAGLSASNSMLRAIAPSASGSAKPSRRSDLLNFNLQHVERTPTPLNMHGDSNSCAAETTRPPAASSVRFNSSYPDHDHLAEASSSVTSGRRK